MNTKSVEAILSARDSGFSNTFKRGQGVLAAFAGETRKSSSAGTGFLGSIKSVAAGMGLYNVAAKAMAQVTGSVAGAMSRADTLYLFNRNVTQTTGSTKIASAALKELSATTTDTAYSLDTVANATQTFNNAQVDLGKSAKYSARFMDMVSRYGDGTNATYERVMVQMGQMTAKGKANLGDIKSAVEANIPVWSIMSKATGRSMGEIRDEVEEGKWTAEEFFDTMMKGTEDIKGSAKDGANTWAGAIGIMKSRFTLGTTEILNGFRRMGEAVTGDRFGLFKGITQIGTLAKTSLAAIGHAVEESTPFVMVLGDAWNKVFPAMKEAASAVTAEIGLFNGSITKAGALQTFSSMVGTATDYIVKFAHFVRDNSEAIGAFVNKVPAAVAAYGSLKMITGVTQAFANFGLTLTDKVGGAMTRLGEMNKVVSNTFIKPVTDTITTGLTGIVTNSGTILGQFGSLVASNMGTLRKEFNGNIFTDFASSVMGAFRTMSPGFDLFSNNLTTSMRQLNELGGNPIGNFFRSFGAAVDLSNGKLAGMTRALFNPKQAIANLGATMMANTGKTTFWSAAVASAGSAVSGGFKAMASGSIAAIRSLSAAMLSNPITAVLLAITAAVATMAFGWKSNFMNIQGVMSSFGSGLKNSITSMKGMFTGLEPVLSATGNAFKGLGKVLTGVLLVAIGAVVDGFRGLVFGATTAVKSVMALGNGISGLWKKIKGDSKGADESFKKMRQNIDDISEGFDNLKNNSATVAAVKSLDEFGKESENVAAKYGKSVQQIIDDTTDMQSIISESTSQMSLAFNTDDATDGIRKYTSTANAILTSFYEKRSAQAEQYNSLMQQAEAASGDEKAKLQQQAADVILSQTDASNKSMLSLHKELSEQLRTNKNIEGQALTEEQRAALEAQNNAIREGLAEQSNLYVQAAMQRLSEGEALSEQQRTAAEAHLKSLYSSQTEMISANETKIKELQEQANVEKTESMKNHLLAQVEELKANNETLLMEQQAYGQQQLQLMLNGNEATAAATLEGLANRKDITSAQLDSIVQAFVANNSSIDEQMALLTGLLGQRGFEGSDKLVAALKSGDMSGLGGQMTTEMLTGMADLPNSLFNKGNEGKTQFINAVKSGDVAGASQYLASGLVTGLNVLPPQMNASGKNAGTQFSGGVDSTKGANRTAGDSIASSGLNATKQKSPQFQASGKTSGTVHATGVSSTTGANNTAGVGISNAALTGAGTNLPYFQPLGYNMGMGVASGLNQALPSVQAAAAAISAAAEKAIADKAKIKSPARAFMPLGKFMGLGVGVGFVQSTKEVISSVADVVDAARNKASDVARKAFNFDTAVASSPSGYNTANTGSDNGIVGKLDSIISLLSQRQTVQISRKTVLDAVDNGMGSNSRREKRRLMK